MSEKKGTPSANQVIKASKNASLVENLGIVKKELDNLKKITESVYKTSGRLVGFNNSVKDETKIDELIKMYSVVVAKEKAYNEAHQELGLGEAPVFKSEGSTREEWKEDIVLRINILQNKERLDFLKGVEKELVELMDKEDKMALLSQKLEKYVKGSLNMSEGTTEDAEGEVV